MATLEFPSFLLQLKKLNTVVKTLRLNYDNNIVGLNQEMEAEFDIPIKKGEWVEIQEGSRHMGVKISPIEKSVICECNKDFFMDRHDHMWDETLVIVKGKVKLDIWNGKKHTIILSEHDETDGLPTEITIPMLTSHSVTALEDSVIFARWNKKDFKDLF